jgi:hypothetical protein
VDFEHGLNAAVKRVRNALGDTAENPQYVETLPRRGYRLIAATVPDPPAVLFLEDTEGLRRGLLPKNKSAVIEH